VGVRDVGRCRSTAGGLERVPSLWRLTSRGRGRGWEREREREDEVGSKVRRIVVVRISDASSMARTLCAFSYARFLLFKPIGYSCILGASFSLVLDDIHHPS
jgi:hypothetical protein